MARQPPRRAKKEAKDELLEEIQQKSPAERAERSALELPRSSGSKEKKRKRSDSSFQLAALPKGVEKIREMHRRHPGRLASLTLQRCAELLAQGRAEGRQVHGQVMASGERAKLPAVARTSS